MWCVTLITAVCLISMVLTDNNQARNNLVLPRSCDTSVTSLFLYKLGIYAGVGDSPSKIKECMEIYFLIQRPKPKKPPGRPKSTSTKRRDGHPSSVRKRTTKPPIQPVRNTSASADVW